MISKETAFILDLLLSHVRDPNVLHTERGAVKKMTSFSTRASELVRYVSDKVEENHTASAKARLDSFVSILRADDPLPATEPATPQSKLPVLHAPAPPPARPRVTSPPVPQEKKEEPAGKYVVTPKVETKTKKAEIPPLKPGEAAIIVGRNHVASIIRPEPSVLVPPTAIEQPLVSTAQSQQVASLIDQLNNQAAALNTLGIVAQNILGDITSREVMDRLVAEAEKFWLDNGLYDDRYNPFIRYADSCLVLLMGSPKGPRDKGVRFSRNRIGGEWISPNAANVYLTKFGTDANLVAIRHGSQFKAFAAEMRLGSKQVKTRRYNIIDGVEIRKAESDVPANPTQEQDK